MKTLPLLWLAVMSAAVGAEPALDAAKQSAAAYSAAYAKGDAAALGAFFADDAEFTQADGSRLSGRAAIEAAIRASLRPGATLEIQVDSAEMLSPDVLLERGSTTLAREGEPSESVRYSAVVTKTGGKWAIRELVESPMPEAAPADALAGLDWLVGTWTEVDKKSGLEIESSFRRARGGKFLTRNVKVAKNGETVLEGWQIVGWHPLEQVLRGWTFDAEGGVSESIWANDGDRWTIRETGMTPEGGVVSAEHVLSRLGEDRASWRSFNRTLDGVPLPEIEAVELVRSRAPTGE